MGFISRVVTSVPKGIKHPDKLVRRKDLYLSPSRRAPNGTMYSGNWRQLYFGGVRRPRRK